MNDSILFTEKQSFRTVWWIWVLLILGTGGFFLGAFKQFFTDQAFGNNSISDSALLLTTLFVILVLFFVMLISLKTQVRQNGIYVRFFPFHLKFRKFEFTSLKKSYVRKYKPILEYGGWGLRWGFNGTAYNISGTKGLQLQLSNDKLLLIGTQKPKELKMVLENLDQHKT